MSLKLTKEERESLRAMFGCRCAYCGCNLPEKGFHADHVEAVYREFVIFRGSSGEKKIKQTGEVYKKENDRIENFFPSCAKCNIFKSTFTIEEFRQEISLQVERARQYSVNFRTAERFGLITVNKPEPIVFWFEKYRSDPSFSGGLNV